jgi:hypothetical protein
MAWTVRNPRFEVKEYDEGWYWSLINEGKGVAQSYGHPDKNDTVDFIRWLKRNGASVPIIGGGVLEL